MTLADPAILSYTRQVQLPPPPPPPPGPPPGVAPTGVASRPLPSVDCGGWKCVRCGNINYPHKLFCNMRKCNAPKPLGNWTCHACGEGGPAPLPLVAQSSSSGAGSVKPLARECDHCLADRKTTRDEDVLLEAHRTGALPSAAAKKNSFAQEFLAAPFGSWICVKCNNVNWPARTTCNGRNCQKTRDTADIDYTRNFKAELEKRGFAVDLIKMNAAAANAPTVEVPSSSPLPGSTVASGNITPADTTRGVIGDLSQGRGTYVGGARGQYPPGVGHFMKDMLYSDVPPPPPGPPPRIDPPGSWICPKLWEC
ncbi:hypothetical protein FOZ60_004437 [Perkinsus olseni]|uniref:RanBP2-type domain-containing protein n=1 Tax=Perkinsus olseni TaxID=32597 RepID=A0A7J6PNC1_PEROL|nr:hypothetical protein FOZ60_004437 [Perkinsus olseni]